MILFSGIMTWKAYVTELFIDTDCISAFLWVDNQALLPKIFPGKIIMPLPVYRELSRPQVSHLKQRVDSMIERGYISVESLTFGTPEYREYVSMINGNDPEFTVVGKGEASAIAFAKERDGVLGSNNLKDIMQFVKAYNLKFLTTGDLLVMAYEKGLISEAEGNEIWEKMLRRRRKLGADSFSSYLSLKRRIVADIV